MRCRPFGTPAPRVLLRLALLAAVAACWPATVAVAQGNLPVVPRYFYEERPLARGDAITYCVNTDALTFEFDVDLARSLSDALLLGAELYEVAPLLAAPPLDYRLGLSMDDIFVLLASKCDAFVGFTLASSGYPDWVRFTRPYYTSRYVMATTDEAYAALSDVPLDHRIGTRYTSQGDIDLVVYLQSLPPQRRWRRAPYANNQLLVERLLDGSVDTVLIWEPALDAALGGDPASAGVRVIRPTPFRPPGVRFGIAVESRDSYLRTLLDDAIAALVRSGRMRELLDAHGVPGDPANAE